MQERECVCVCVWGGGGGGGGAADRESAKLQGEDSSRSN